MKKEELIAFIGSALETIPLNTVDADSAITPELVGLRLYDAPLVGFAKADDPYFAECKRPGVIHPDYRTPTEWLPEAETVISVFLPFTERVRASNRSLSDIPYAPGLPQHCSAEWLHARIEGQEAVNALSDRIEEFLRAAGYSTVAPTTSGELKMLTPYISTWSERHAAFAAGLGTFSLSKGLITKRGMAGRFCSVITDAVFVPDVRDYTDPFEYCTLCGACEKRCPASAIDRTRGCALGKDQTLCGGYIKSGRLPPQGARAVVRYGCGKCQVAVPCECGIPKKISR